MVAVGAGIAIWAVTRSPTAEDAAMDYLEALAAGDYATISAMRDQPLDEAAERIVEDAFAGASNYLTDPEIEEIAETSGVTGVTATADFAGDRRTVFFMLGSDGDSWRLTGDYLGAVDVATNVGNAVWIGDALAPAHTDVPLLPAVYPVGPAPSGILVAEPQEVAVSNDETSAVTLEASLSAEATAAAQTQLDAYADGCAQASDAVPANCGIRVPWAADLATLTSIAFRIEAYPAVALSSDARSFAATGGAFVATASGTTRDGSAGTFTYRAGDWALRGSLRFEGDEMVLAVH